jgi:class 3 adenylate cyclase
VAEIPQPRRRERKVVTMLFCDLVGFTSQAEALDPEDVEAILRPYHERVRAELERHGGTVEKFIGDAVAALFGAPTAHEDDPERAVRAALAIRDFALDQERELRIGITTGEALISLDASVAGGEGMASGDVVNTAARLQAAAPVNAILVDKMTHRATRQAIDYEEGPAVTAKGKAHPVPAWQALAARSRFGADAVHHVGAELVGRERELAMLHDAFIRATQDRTPQLVTLIGVPGIGKSRLVHELSRIADQDPRLVTWRQGRCLAYGDGVTFWALSEMVKAQAGILERDSEEVAADKLRASVETLLPDGSDRHWVESHLRPLIGLEGETRSDGDRRAEAFAAWRRFLEGLAEERPAVLVFEDLHWADDGLLDFVDELVDWMTDAPLLVIATARPELLTRRPGWGGGKLNALTVGLSPLTEAQTGLLIERMLERSSLPPGVQRALLDRAEGNPLYAEQFTRLYAERGSTHELPLPETLQGILAARIDGIPREEKEILQSAAVMGKVFWAGALGVEARQVGARLHSLERKGFVVRQRRSSVGGDSEWSFAHMLLRDAAYARIPRARRSAMHRRAAEWIAAAGRPEDHAELLAYHWKSARDLAAAAGMDPADLTEPTRLALRAAGDRAFAINAYPGAAAHYDAALELWPDQDPELGWLVYRHALSLYRAADDKAHAALEVARDALLAAGDADAAAEAEIWLSRIEWERGERDRAREHERRAAELVHGRRSPAAARVLASVARTRMIDGDAEGSLRVASEAYAMADALALDELRAHALATIGSCKQDLDDPSGAADLERALQVAIDANSASASGIANNTMVQAILKLDLRRAVELWELGRRLAERFGDAPTVRWFRGQEVPITLIAGHWDAALARADIFIAECESGSPHYLESSVRVHRARMRTARGDIRGAHEDLQRALVLARRAEDPQQVGHVTGSAAAIFAETGLESEALELAGEMVSYARRHPRGFAVFSLALTFLFSPLAEAFEAQLREVVREAPLPRWQELATACLDRDFVRAAEIWAAAGSPTWEAQLRLRAAEHLAGAGQAAAAREQAEKAAQFYRSVDASAYIWRAEELPEASRST